MIREIDIFRGIEHEVMEEIAKACKEVNYPKGTIIFKRGENAEYLYLLIDGSINLLIENGGSIRYTFSEQGFIFGWSAILDNARYTASAECGTDVKAYKIDGDILHRIFSQFPKAGCEILKRLAAKIAERLNMVYRDLLLARAGKTEPSYG